MPSRIGDDAPEAPVLGGDAYEVRAWLLACEEWYLAVFMIEESSGVAALRMEFERANPETADDPAGARPWYPAADSKVLWEGVEWRVAMTRRKPLGEAAGGLSLESRYDDGWATLTRGVRGVTGLVRPDREEVEVEIPRLREYREAMLAEGKWPS